MQGAAVLAASELRIPLTGLGQGGLAQHLNDGIVGGPEALEAVEQASRQLDRRQTAQPEQAAKLGYGEEGRVGHVGRESVTSAALGRGPAAVRSARSGRGR